MASPLPISPIPNQTPKFHYSSSAPTTVICSSSFVKRVCLSKWWLIETEIPDPNSKRLGVGGFAFREGQGIRVFRSAAISKRHDIDSIETVDGVTINLIGLINEPRTLKNGFPSKVCDLFHFGFPYEWEEYAARNCGEESNKDDTRVGVSTLNCTNNYPLPTSFDDIPVTQVRNILMSPTSDSEYRAAVSRIIVNDILRKCDNYNSSKKHRGPTLHPNDASVYETPRDHRRHIINEKTTTQKESSKNLDETSSPRVATRNMRKRKFEKTLFSTSSAVASGVGEPFCEKESGGRIGCSNGEETRVVEKFAGSALRRSKRLNKA